MLKYLLDTNTISEPARPLPNRRLLGRLHRHEFEIAIANVDHFEPFEGIRIENWMK